MQEPESTFIGMAGHELGDMKAISGYAQAYMPQSHRFGGSSASNPLVVPFTAQLGRSKNAHVEGAGITITGAGLWVAKALLVADNGSGTPSLTYQIVLQDRDGQLLDYKDYPGQVGAGRWGTGHYFEHTFVAPEEWVVRGLQVRVRLRHTALWWTWLGGPQSTSLTLNRWDLRTDNPAPAGDVELGEDIGSEPDPEAEPAVEA